MSAKKMLILFIVALLSISLCTSVSLAANTSVLLQGCTWEENIDVFVSGEFETNDIQFEVSKQAAEVTDSGLLADKGVTIRTTILLDISTSMPQNMRPKVKEYIDYCIEKLGLNEELRIITFGNEMVVLQDFTSDRYDLSRVTPKIEFNGQQSMIYDAIYNSIPDIQPIDGNPCFYRTIIITDGVDKSTTGITKEELYLKLQQSTYPIEVIAVSENGQNGSEKELSALTRISNGRYINFQSESNLEQSLLGVDNIVWIRAKLPNDLLDGSTRQINISDGVNSLQFDFKVPMFNVAPSDEPEESEAPSEGAGDSQPENTELTSSEEITPSMPVPQPQKSESNSDTIIIIAIAGVVATVIIMLVVILILRNRKKSKAPNKKGKEATTITDGGAETEVLSGGTTVRLRKIDDPNKVWEVQLSEPIMVGRDKSCQIFIDEGSVSRQQCVLYTTSDGTAMIENKSKSNVTQVNKVKLDNPQSLNEGDQIKCGRIILVVDSIHKEPNSTSGKINKITQFVNV